MSVNLRSVEEASAWQRRLYRTLRETMRAMAGRLSRISSWPAKKMLARHIWLDSENANAIRERVLELRFPRVDVEVEVDRSLMAVLACLPSSHSDAEFLAGVYCVVKPAILEAAQQYLRGLEKSLTPRASGIFARWCRISRRNWKHLTKSGILYQRKIGALHSRG
jgi:hypothetical protein